MATNFKRVWENFKKRGEVKLPTAGYSDLEPKNHARAFVVAGAMKDSLLEDIYNSLKNSYESGVGYGQFKADFGKVVKKHGWSYKGDKNWRSRIIYETNMLTSLAEASYSQQIANKKTMPYLQYRHSHNSANPRPQHLQWDKLVLPIDDPFWNTHYPPNGWGCKCRVFALSEKDLDREGLNVGKSPEIRYENKIIGVNSAYPRVVKTPVGVNPSFGTNVSLDTLAPLVSEPQWEAVLKERGLDAPLLEGVDLPQPTKIKKKPLNPLANLEEQKEAIDEFLRAFSTKLGGVSKLFRDIAGNSIAISDKLFYKKDKDGKNIEIKAFKDDRLDSINLLSNTIIKPDEIWYHWDKDPNEKGRWRLKRRYLKAFEVDGAKDYVIGVFEWSSTARIWSGTTIYNTSSGVGNPPDWQERFNKQRIGDLIYKSKK